MGKDVHSAASSSSRVPQTPGTQKLNAPYEAEAKTQAMKKRKSFAGAGESPG